MFVPHPTRSMNKWITITAETDSRLLTGALGPPHPDQSKAGSAHLSSMEPLRGGTRFYAPMETSVVPLAKDSLERTTLLHERIVLESLKRFVRFTVDFSAGESDSLVHSLRTA